MSEVCTTVENIFQNQDSHTKLRFEKMMTRVSYKRCATTIAITSLEVKTSGPSTLFIRTRFFTRSLNFLQMLTTSLSLVSPFSFYQLHQRNKHTNKSEKPAEDKKNHLPNCTAVHPNKRMDKRASGWASEQMRVCELLINLHEIVTSRLKTNKLTNKHSNIIITITTYH